MKNILNTALYILLIIIISTSTLFAQESSSRNCSLINESRNSFFIEFEKMEETDKERNIILKLQNNSTCDIQVISSDVDYFTERTNKPPFFKIRNQLNDKELVPDLQFYTRIDFQNLLLSTTTSNGGDNLAGLFLKGGNSLLFSVPFKNFQKGLAIVIPFEFKWETEWTDKKGAFRYGGDTKHLVWFSYYKLPDEIKKELKIK